LQFGLCAAPEEAATVLAAGFDYLEGWAAKLFAPDGTVPDIDPRVIPCTNGFFGPDVKIYESTEAAIERGVRTATKAREFGVEVMVIGSGNARRAPEGRVAQSYDRIFVAVAAAIQTEVPGVTIAPEPLNRKECNVGLDLRRLADLTREAGISYCADSYHVLQEWMADDVSPSMEMWRIAMPHCPRHVHISGADRKPPRADDTDLQMFVARLKELGYQGRVSVEASRENDLDSLVRVRAELASLFS